MSRILRGRRNTGCPDRAVEAALVATAQGALMIRRGLTRQFNDLWDTELKVYSQWGEDGILDFLCDSLRISKPTVVEFGAGDFTECNSRFLAANRSAAVVAIDSRADLVAGISAGDIRWRTTLHALCRWVTPENARETLAESLALLESDTLDILSIDLDGLDYWIVEQLDLTAVSLIVAEYNPLFGSAKPVSVPNDKDFDRTTAHSSWLYFGASLPAWVHLLQRRGFSLVGTNRAGNNAFFVRQERRSEVPVAPLDPSHLQRYVQWNVRESRDPDGRLSFLHGTSRVVAMADMPLVNVVNGESLRVSDV